MIPESTFLFLTQKCQHHDDIILGKEEITFSYHVIPGGVWGVKSSACILFSDNSNEFLSAISKAET